MSLVLVEVVDMFILILDQTMLQLVDLVVVEMVEHIIMVAMEQMDLLVSVLVVELDHRMERIQDGAEDRDWET